MTQRLQCLQMFVSHDKQQDPDNDAANGMDEVNVCQFVALRAFWDECLKLTNRQTFSENWPNGP